jgi:hypothetical protein
MEGAAEGATKVETQSRQSLAKKPSARRNLRHGLAAISRHNPGLWPEIERIAKAICNGDANPLLLEQATVIAETEIVLRCMRLEKVRLIERFYGIPEQSRCHRKMTAWRGRKRDFDS